MTNVLLRDELVMWHGEVPSLRPEEVGACDYTRPEDLPDDERLLGIWQDCVRNVDRFQSMVGLLVWWTKRRWEQAYAHEHPTVRGVLLAHELERLSETPASFAPAIPEWLCRAQSANLIDGSNRDRALFESVAEQVRLGKVFLRCATGPEAQLLAGEARREAELLEVTESELACRFLNRKTTWVVLHGTLGELALEAEEQRHANGHVRARWLAEFGAGFHAEQHARQTVRALLLRRELLLANPALTRGELDQLVAEREENERAALRELKRDISRSIGIVGPHRTDDAGYVDPELLARYRDQLMLTLRELKCLLHPDRLERDPRYALLTSEVKAEIAAIFHRWGPLKASELRFDPAQVGYSLPMLERLLCDLGRARSLLEHAGMQLDPRLIVRGSTLEERVVWLDREIAFLRTVIEQEEAHLLALQEDAEIRGWHEDLQCPGAWAEIKEEQAKRTQDLRARIESLTSAVEALLTRAATETSSKEDAHGPNTDPR